MSRFGLMKAEMLHRDGAQRHRCKPIILRLVQFTEATMFQHVDLTFMEKQGSGGELADQCMEVRVLRTQEVWQNNKLPKPSPSPSL